MQKLITLLVVLLFSTVIHAKFIKAVLYMEDGTKKTGLAELVDSGDSKVSFRTDEKAKTEKLISIDIKKIEYTDEEGNQYVTERLFMTTANSSGTKITKSKDKKWFYIVYDKAVKIGVIATPGSTMASSNGTTIVNRFPDASYFFGTKTSDDLFFGYYKSGSAMSANTAGSADKLMKKMAKTVFADCPKIIDAVEKEEFKSKSAADQMIAISEKVKCK